VLPLNTERVVRMGGGGAWRARSAWADDAPQGSVAAAEEKCRVAVVVRFDQPTGLWRTVLFSLFDPAPT